jgi:ribosomal protein S12 methylthiotransferase
VAETDFYIGRTEADSPEVNNEVIIPKSSGYACIGYFAKVRITEVAPYDLYGELLG